MLLLGVVVAGVVLAILLINLLICWQLGRNYFQLLINDLVVDETDPVLEKGGQKPSSYALLKRRPQNRIAKDITTETEKELPPIEKPKCRHSIGIKCEKRVPHFSGTCVLVLTTTTAATPITASAAAAAGASAVPGEPTNILSPPSSPLVASWLQFWISFSAKPSTIAVPRQTTSKPPLQLLLLLLGVYLPLHVVVVLVVALKTVSALVRTVMVDPLKIFWVLTNSTYLGNVPRSINEKVFWWQSVWYFICGSVWTREGELDRLLQCYSTINDAGNWNRDNSRYGGLGIYEIIGYPHRNRVDGVCCRRAVWSEPDHS